MQLPLSNPSLLFSQFPVLYEDSRFIAIHKPAHILSHPNPSQPRERTSFLGNYNLEQRRFNTPGGPLWLIHRLDQETSGVLLAAKSEEDALRVREWFEQGKVEKIYLAMVKGRPKGDHGVWKDCIEKQKYGTHVRSTIIPRQAPNAELHYSPCEQIDLNPNLNLRPKGVYNCKVPNHPAYSFQFLRIQLITGKTHQIRVQAASRNLHILGDTIYGDFGLNKLLKTYFGLKRLFLHASSLRFKPSKKALAPISITAPFPLELGDVLNKMQTTLRSQPKKSP